MNEDSSSEEEIIAKPEIVKPTIVKTISHQETFHTQMKERNEMINAKI